MSVKRIVVVGGGAAGLLAAGRAAHVLSGTDASVTLLEKMPRPARKLRITGKGRCNVTNMAAMPEFIGHFGAGGRFLRPAFSTFFAAELLALLGEQGVDHVVERGGRVFPASGKAQDVVDALVGWARREGARVRCDTPVRGLLVEAGRVGGVETDGGVVPADAVIIAVGGASYTGTGSTGDGYAMAETAGHTITAIRPALVPLLTGGDTAARLQGVSLRNVRASVWSEGRKISEAFGEMVFTHFGLSGPIILTLSRTVVDLLGERRPVEISIDLKPALEHDRLDARLLRDLDENGKRQFANLLKGLLTRKLIPVCIDAVGIGADRPGHQISAAERKKLRLWLKDLRLEVTGHRPLNEAIVTAGGVTLKEVDPKTMASRRCEGLYFAGEVLDLDADTGGYNVQAAFSTGWLAGQSAASPHRT